MSGHDQIRAGGWCQLRSQFKALLSLFWPVTVLTVKWKSEIEGDVLLMAIEL